MFQSLLEWHTFAFFLIQDPYLNTSRRFDAQSLNGLAFKILKGKYSPMSPGVSKDLKDCIKAPPAASPQKPLRARNVQPCGVSEKILFTRTPSKNNFKTFAFFNANMGRALCMVKAYSVFFYSIKYGEIVVGFCVSQQVSQALLSTNPTHRPTLMELLHLPVSS